MSPCCNSHSVLGTAISVVWGVIGSQVIQSFSYEDVLHINAFQM